MNYCPWCSTQTCKCGRMMLATANDGTCLACGHGDIAYSDARRRSPSEVFLTVELRQWLASTPPTGTTARNRRPHTRRAHPALADALALTRTDLGWT